MKRSITLGGGGRLRGAYYTIPGDVNEPLGDLLRERIVKNGKPWEL